MAEKLPTFDKLMNPLLRALRNLGGSGSVDEIYSKVVELQEFPDSVLSQLHDAERSTETEVAYRLAWARTYLKKYGLLENSARGVWALSPKAKDTDKVDPQEVVKTVRSGGKGESAGTSPVTLPPTEVSEEEAWRQHLHVILTQKLVPAAFEKLVQRVLRESGFTQVEVTGRSGDGGIDGHGIARIQGGFLRFHVLFQCKRYKGTVSPSEIRDFRGALQGRADKGLFITTGTFSAAAQKEARRDGALAIDLFDGADLANTLKDLGLGVRTQQLEVVTIDDAWFDGV
jgi:restriction system protein